MSNYNLSSSSEFSPQSSAVLPSPEDRHQPETAPIRPLNDLLREGDLASVRDVLRCEFQACRAATLDLFSADIQGGGSRFCQQAHPDFSPTGWHLGHIGFTESLWVLEHMAQMPPVAEYRVLFAQDGLPKAERQNLPAIAEIVDYLEQIRRRVLDYLDKAPVNRQIRLWWFLLQHESQHAETIAMVHRLLERSHPVLRRDRQSGDAPSPCPSRDMVYVPAGSCQIGSDDPVAALDNEGPSHQHKLDAYWIDRFPVTCASYRQFMQAGGYQTEAWWSPAGWQWLQRHPVSQPLYWDSEPGWNSHPVCGVSWYEAEAYANFAGKRLPTEAEWERAARWCPQAGQLPYPWGKQPPTPQRCNADHRIGQTTPVEAFECSKSPSGCVDMLGNVWEWTAERFEAYPQFRAYPYAGYSQAYFDQKHYVLRGGSWATPKWTLRPSFRNWYTPDVRQIFAGFRCASSTG